MKNNGENFWRYQNKPYLCIAFETETLRTFSSAGSERLPYKQRVGGSNPSTSTKKILSVSVFKKARTFSSAGSERLPYKQRVGGSNPSTSTQKIPFQESVFRKDLGRLAQLVQSVCLTSLGRLAQLVQSVCLTSRGSAVRIRQRPQLLYPKNAIIGSPASDCRAIFFVLIRRGCERLLPPCGQESVQSSSSPYSVPVGFGGAG